MLFQVRGARYFEEDRPQSRSTRLGRLCVLVWLGRMLWFLQCFRPTGADRSFKKLLKVTQLEFAPPCTLCSWRRSSLYSGPYRRLLKLAGRVFAAKEYRVGKDLVDQRTCLQARRNFGTRRSRAGAHKPSVHSVSRWIHASPHPYRLCWPLTRLRRISPKCCSSSPWFRDTF